MVIASIILSDCIAFILDFFGVLFFWEFGHPLPALTPQ
jgi:hypothetical protein